jgi:HlyD family secretion protein
MELRRRTGWLLGAVAVVLGLGSAGVYQLTSGEQKSNTAPATARVQRGTVTNAVAASGTLQPAQTRGLAFSMTGTVTEVRVRAGDQVAAGAVLARIDDTDAKERVSSAQDALDSAQEALDEAADSSSSTSDSTCLAAAALVTTASPTPTPTPSPTPSASASRPTQPQASASTNRQSAQNAATCDTGGSDTGRDRIFSAQQQVNSAKEQLAEAEENLAGTTITAPIAGKVLSVAGAVGSRATAGGSGFIVLGDVADMQVKADFPEADASGLKVGQKATVTLADRPDEQIAAKVTQVDPIGTADGQMVRFGVLLAFDKVPSDLLNGQSADVRVQTASATNVLYVPASAVHDIADGTGTVRLRSGERSQVQVGLRGDQYTEIRSGLNEGDEVLTSW